MKQKSTRQSHRCESEIIQKHTQQDSAVLYMVIHLETQLEGPQEDANEVHLLI